MATALHRILRRRPIPVQAAEVEARANLVNQAAPAFASFIGCSNGHALKEIDIAVIRSRHAAD
jgi:hypothetical protein